MKFNYLCGKWKMSCTGNVLEFQNLAKMCNISQGYNQKIKFLQIK